MDLSEICILKRPIGRMCLLLFLFLVTCEEATRQLVQVLRVIHFDLGAPPEEILQLSHHRHLRLDPVVEASQLLVQLCPNIWKSEKIQKEKFIHFVQVESTVSLLWQFLKCFTTQHQPK